MRKAEDEEQDGGARYDRRLENGLLEACRFVVTTDEQVNHCAC